MSKAFSTKNAEEVAKFDRLAAKWWDVEGEFKPLHQINPIRIEYIRNQVVKHFKLKRNSTTPFTNLKFLDVGCGGGLITIPMHNLGADITGIDASPNNIGTASAQAKKLKKKINFVNSTIEDLAAKSSEKYDVILALEIIEHVDNVEFFLKNLSDLLKPGGLLIITTINRTIKSFMLAKIAAEYILRILPIGTHDWNKFIKPSEITDQLKSLKLKQVNISGMTLSIPSFSWTLSRDVDVNYLLTLSKNP